DWDELLAINPEIVGWIYINDTKIDYPVLWHKSDDMYSQYYLNHNYKGDWDSYGTIFLDYRDLDGTDSKNVVMHGHHMNDGSMFGNLMSYAGMSGNLDFYGEAPIIEFDTPKADGKYKIISVFKTNTLSSQGEFFNYLRADFQNEKDFMNYVYDVRVRSLINCPVDVNEDDELITLSTCSYEFTNFRTVVVARRVRIGEKAEVDTSKASINDNAVWPEVYYNAYGGTRPKVTDFVTAYENKEIDWYDGKLDFKDQKVTGTTDEDDETTAGSTKKGTTAQPTTELRIFHTVTFINYDGSEISTQEVEDGLSADPPADPVKPSDEYFDYVFKGWQLDFNVVQSDMTIAPNFEAVRKPAESQ
ncbi:MAG: class B sortase, partial [Ruminococcus sp.]|nr:class B sortase [Ruminococcus sp.]